MTTKPEHRRLLACVLSLESSARKAHKLLRNMGATNIRPDYMLVRNAEGTYDRVDDPGAWNANVRGMHVAMIRFGANDWSLHS